MEQTQVEAKKNLTKLDKKWMKEFRDRYPGWDVVRLVDNSLVFTQPDKNAASSS